MLRGTKGAERGTVAASRRGPMSTETIKRVVTISCMAFFVAPVAWTGTWEADLGGCGYNQRSTVTERGAEPCADPRASRLPGSGKSNEVAEQISS
jgi:hypothetical protein